MFNLISNAPSSKKHLHCMGKKKSNAASAAPLMESSVAPIVEIYYQDPLFTMAAHPTRPIIISGLGTGYLYCNTYDVAELEEYLEKRRQEVIEIDKRAYAAGTIPHITTSVSQLKTHWWKYIGYKDIHNTGSYIKNNWQTKRHKGSCRHAIFDPRSNSSGEFVYSCGTDNIIKKAATELGKVVGKVDVTSDYTDPKDKLTKLCHSTTHPFLLSGTEDGHVLVYDSSNLSSNKLKFKVNQVHDDAINQILTMPQSPYHYLTLGSTTLSHIDIRKGIITQSDDQEDELLAMSYTTDELSEGKGDTVLVGHGEGLVTIWKNSKNKLMDQLSRIKINKQASIDAIIPTMNNDSEEMAQSVWCGDSDGLLHRINYKRGKIVETRVHSASWKSDLDEVGILDIDYEYRLISAGMERLKIWSNKEVDDVEDEGNEDESGDHDSDDDPGASASDIASEETSDLDLGSEDDAQEEENSDDDEVEEMKSQSEDEDNTQVEDVPPAYKRKRRDFTETITKPKSKRIDINKLTKLGNDENDAPPEEPQLKKQKKKDGRLTAKQLRNMQTREHGIKKFEDL